MSKSLSKREPQREREPERLAYAHGFADAQRIHVALDLGVSYDDAYAIAFLNGLAEYDGDPERVSVNVDISLSDPEYIRCAQQRRDSASHWRR